MAAHPAEDGPVDEVTRLAAEGSWTEAIALSRERLKGGDDKDAVLIALAAGAVSAHRPDRALRALEQVSRERLDAPPGLILRCDALMGAGQASEAIGLAERYRVAHPEDAAVADWLLRHRPDAAPVARGPLPLESYGWAVRAAQAGHFGRALRVLRRVALDHPDDPQVRTLREQVALAYLEEEDEEDALMHGMPFPEVAAPPLELL